MSEGILREARNLLLVESFGILSTHSHEVGGYPFGSVTPYCLDQEQNPILLISRIAQHTSNIEHNPKVALTVLDVRAPDVQAGRRITLVGDASEVHEEETEVRDRYFRYFPQSESYFGTHEFSFYRLNSIRCYYIGGFGNIHWLEPEDLCCLNPFTIQEEEYIVTHMNNDHAAVLRSLCLYYKDVDLSGVDVVIMVGVDREGFDLLADGEKVRLDFKVEVATSEEARDQLVAMAREASTEA